MQHGRIMMYETQRIIRFGTVAKKVTLHSSDIDEEFYRVLTFSHFLTFLKRFFLSDAFISLALVTGC